MSGHFLYEMALPSGVISEGNDPPRSTISFTKIRLVDIKNDEHLRMSGTPEGKLLGGHVSFVLNTLLKKF